jgi:hypothetical protein
VHGCVDPASNPNLTALSSSAKPSFLFSDKVYTKLSGAEDETWLLRATEVTFAFLNQYLGKSEALRCVFFHSISLHIRNIQS